MTTSRFSALLTSDLVFERNKEGRKIFAVDLCISRQGILIKFLDIPRGIHLDEVEAVTREGVMFCKQT